MTFFRWEKLTELASTSTTMLIKVLICFGIGVGALLLTGCGLAVYLLLKFRKIYK
jgi:hypothetical protein